MTLTTHREPHLTTSQFRAAFVLVYVIFGIVTLLIWAGVGFNVA
jgi:hypothetical protein